jgi:hypothetical protein
MGVFLIFWNTTLPYLCNNKRVRFFLKEIGLYSLKKMEFMASIAIGSFIILPIVRRHNIVSLAYKVLI